MSLRDNLKNASEAIVQGATGAADFISNTALDVGKKATEAASEGANIVADSLQKMQHNMRLEKYNPVFAEEFHSQDYDLPNLIVVADGDSRKNIDVCKGAIGWLEKDKGIEALHLYEEYIPFCCLDFFPSATLNTAYYVHPLESPLNKKKYVDLRSFCHIVQKEKMTELRNIAHSLGAKKCYLESYEEKKTESRLKTDGGAKVKHFDVSGESSGSYKEEERTVQNCSIIFSQEFEGSEQPIKPELKWFKHDTEINSLIKMRCSDENRIKKYDIDINTKLFSAMSRDMAIKIDAILNRSKINLNLSKQEEIEKDTTQKLKFIVEF